MDYDSPWKEILDSFFPFFMEFFFPRAYNEIDWERGFEPLDTELRQIVREAEMGRRTVDKLVKVWLRSGKEAWLLIHVEVQVQEDEGFEERMFVYHYRSYDRFGRPIVSLAVLGDERTSWRPHRMRYEKWGCGVEFHFPIIKLLDYAADVKALEKSSNPFATVVLAHLRTLETHRDPNARRSRKTTLVQSLYERGFDRETIRQLFRFIAWMMELPRELEVGFWEDLHAYEESKKMPYVTNIERIWLEQGIEKGRQEGRQEGQRVGEEQGVRKGLLQAIEQAVDQKFGAAAASICLEARNVPSNAGLSEIHRAIFRVGTIDELAQIIRDAKVLKNDD